MKKYIPIVLALALAGSATAFAKSPKRGVSEDQFTFESQLRILARSEERRVGKECIHWWI